MEVYVNKFDGSSYCELESEDEREVDRFAWRRLSDPGVRSVEVKLGSSGGFVRRRGSFR